MGDITVSELYLITGRVVGDDDDTAHIVEAACIESGEERFKDYLLSVRELANDTEVYVISSVPLLEAIEERI